MKSIKILFIIFTLLGFAFLITQQRLESKNYDRQLRKIKKEIELVNSEQRENLLLIEKEMQRLSLGSSDNIGKPISLNDIILIRVSDEVLIPSATSSISYQKENTRNKFQTHLQQLITFFGESFNQLKKNQKKSKNS